MGRLNIGDIQPGMLIAADVLDRNGRVLLKAGLEISEKHLTILKQWGVTDADIQGVSREEATAAAIQNIDQEVLDKVEKEHAALFRHTDLQHPFSAELLRLAVLRHVHRMQGGIE